MLTAHRHAPLWGPAVLAACALAAPAARAAVTTYTSQSAFTAAVTGTTTTFTFTGQVTQGTDTLTVDGVTITDTNVDGGNPEESLSMQDGFPSGSFITNGVSGTLTFALPSGTTAFGVDIGTDPIFPGSLVLTAGTGTATISPALGTAGFLGFTSTVPLTSATVTYGDGTDDGAGYVLGGVTFGSAGTPPPPAAPEPSTLAPFALAALGLSALMLRARRRRAA